MERIRRNAWKLAAQSHIFKDKMDQSISDKKIGSLKFFANPPKLQHFPFDSFAQGFWVIGPDVETLDSKPKTLFSIPNYNTDDLLLQTCFPSDTLECKIINDPKKFIQNVMDDVINSVHFFILYFPQAKFAPFYYCAKYQANHLKLPSFAHNLTFDQICERISLDKLPTFEVCLVVRANQPDHSLYLDFLWNVILSENYGRHELRSFFESYTNTKDYNKTKAEIDVSKLSWPSTQRDQMKTLLNKVIRMTFAKDQETFSFKEFSYPKLSYTREVASRIDYNLAKFALKSFLFNFTKEGIIKVFQCLFLEKTMIVFSKDIQLLSLFIISLNLSIFPLQIEISTLPLLPNAYQFLINTDEKKIIGITSPLQHEIKNCLYIQLAHNSVEIDSTYSDVFPEIPRSDKILECFDEFFYDEDEEEKGKRTLDLISGIVSGLTLPVENCISSVDGKIVFDKEKYKSYYIINEEKSEFIEQFAETMMLKHYVDSLGTKIIDNL